MSANDLIPEVEPGLRAFARRPPTDDIKVEAFDQLVLDALALIDELKRATWLLDRLDPRGDAEAAYGQIRTVPGTGAAT